MQLFDQEVSSITNNLKTYLFHTERHFSSVFPIYFPCTVSVFVKHCEWVDHIELVILKVALESKKCVHPCITCIENQSMPALIIKDKKEGN